MVAGEFNIKPNNRHAELVSAKQQAAWGYPEINSG